MRIVKAALVILVMMILSCAGDEDMSVMAPLWVDDEIKVEEDSLLFTAVGYGADKEAAAEDLSENMTGKILKHMGLSEEDFSSYRDERDYLNSLFRAFLEGEDGIIPGGKTENFTWYREGEQLAAAARFRYGREEYEKHRDQLRSYLSGGSEYDRLLARAGELAGDGYGFSAFLYDMDAAREGVNRGGLLAGYLRIRAFAEAASRLENSEVPPITGPETVYLGARRSWTYLVQIPLSPEEDRSIPWAVEMTVPASGGKSDVLDISLPSDREGLAELSYPFPSGTGQGRVRFTLYPGPWDNLFEDLSSLEENAGRELVSQLDRFTLERVLPVRQDRSVLKTALVIEDRDVAGRVLDSRTTEESVLSRLKEQNYKVEPVEFDLESLRGMSELEMVREFNSHYGNNYDIILFCEAGIRSFSQRGELYQMNAGAVLYEADLWEHRVNVIEDIKSSVTGNDPTGLVRSAFYQLGMDIADACLKLNNN